MQLTWKANYQKFRDRVMALIGVDDLVEPRAEQILLATLTPLLWPHPPSLRSITLSGENHDIRFEEIQKPNLQGNRPASPKTWQTRKPDNAQST